MVRLPGGDEPWRRALVWVNGSSHDAVTVITRLLTCLDPDTASLPPGLAHAVVGYLRRYPRIQVDDALAERWAPHVTGTGRAPVPGVVLIDPVHTVLWHLTAAGITGLTDLLTDDVLAACDTLIRAHTVLDGRDGLPTLIAGAWRGVALHHQGRCAQALSELQSVWISWHLQYGHGDNPVYRAFTSVLATDCPAAYAEYAAVDHQRVTAWLDEEVTVAQIATTLRPAPVTTSVRVVPGRPSWAGLPGPPAPARLYQTLGLPPEHTR